MYLPTLTLKSMFKNNNCNKGLTLFKSVGLGKSYQRHGMAGYSQIKEFMNNCHSYTIF